MSFADKHNRPQVCGIVNVTPDSFSDGGRFLDPEQGIFHALQLVAAGADMLDIGGESTRPGAKPVTASEELKRVLPVIAGIRQKTNIPVSIDTMKPEVAREAIKAGADIWNDVSALRHDPYSLETAASLNCKLVLMHMQGVPETMQDMPVYDDLLAEVISFLQTRIAAAIAAGVDRDKIFVDPGIGFGKSVNDNLDLLNNLERIAKETDCPVWLGASRKRFIAAIDTGSAEGERLGGSLAALSIAFLQNTDVVRVHDVRQSVQFLDVLSAIRLAKET